MADYGTVIKGVDLLGFQSNEELDDVAYAAPTKPDGRDERHDNGDADVHVPELLPRLF